MADDKNGREKQAADEERRQRKRAAEEALARGDEAEPERGGDEGHDRGTPEGNLAQLDGRDPGRHLGDLDDALEAHDYPVTTADLVAAHGDHQLESEHGWRSVADLLAPLDEETFASADEVRERLLGLLKRR